MDIGQLLQNPVEVIRDLLVQLLTSLGLAPQAADVILMVVGVIIIGSFCLLLPLFLIWLAKSTSRMAFLVTTPISIRIPISTGIDTAFPVMISPAATPPMASGSEKRMVKG